ncbi:hypothetical protein SAMN05421754_100412 [Nitrosomonas sp. Nm58]|nr:hypothetical protein SAMN05421754_100412 [Nitrosomonas sp. Nm58]
MRYLKLFVVATKNFPSITTAFFLFGNDVVVFEEEFIEIRICMIQFLYQCKWITNFPGRRPSTDKAVKGNSFILHPI